MAFERPTDQTATGWIDSVDTGEPVTGKVEADPGKLPEAMILMSVGPYGNISFPAQPPRLSSPAQAHH